MKETPYTMTQRRFLRGTQKLTLEAHTLRIERRRRLSSEQQSFDLHDFQPEPLRIKRIPLGRMLISLVSVAFMTTLLTVGIRSTRDSTSAAAIFFGRLLVFITPITVIPTCFGFVNVVAFQSIFFRQIRVWYGLPDKATFDEVIGVLSERIRETRARGHTIVRELRLANIIDDQQYNEALRLLFNGDSSTHG